MFVGASLQNCSGDPEAGADIRSVQPEAEAQLHGEGQAGL